MIAPSDLDNQKVLPTSNVFTKEVVAALRDEHGAKTSGIYDF